jgi:glycine/D-amino acid oxidase-like deaminating enzyme
MQTAISIWEHETFFAPNDVIIVGAGFLGLWSALEFITRKPGLRISILDSGIIPLGASTRNAGFACFGSPTEMISDVQQMGENEMWSLVEMRFKGINKIKQHFKENVIDYEPSGGYECFASDSEELKAVEEKICWLNEGMRKITGAVKSFTWRSEKLQQFGMKDFGGMIENEMEGGLHSGKLLQSLTRKVQSLGVNIFNGVKVDGFDNSNGFVNVYTSANTFKAAQLLVCTNAMSSKLIKDFEVEPARGQVLITDPIEGLKMKGTFHYDEGYYYFRNVGDRILIGGARNKDFEKERSHEFLLNELIQNELEQFVTKHLLPQTRFTISHRWSGIMGFSEKKLPVIKEVQENVFAAVACNGMGVALSPVIAEKLYALMN